MKHITILSGLCVASSLFSSQKLTVANDTGRDIRIVYVHKKSPASNLPDYIGVEPGRTRRLPNTAKNPTTIGLDVNGKLLKDYDAIAISDKHKLLTIHEYVPGMLALSQNGNIIAQVKIE